MTTTPQPPIHVTRWFDNIRHLAASIITESGAEKNRTAERIIMTCNAAIESNRAHRTPDREGPIEKLERRLTGAITQRDAHKRHRHKTEEEKMNIKIDIWEQAIAIVKQHFGEKP